MDFMSQISQYIMTGLSVGSFYALVAMGFVIIYNVSGIINFAQGEFVMLGAMISVSLIKAGIPVPLSFIISVIAVMLFGVIMERLAIRPARKASPVTLIIITIGASIIIRGAALLIWGTEPYNMNPFSEGKPVHFIGAYLDIQRFWVMGVLAVIVVLLYIFFEMTFWGKALRACVVNRLAARLMGISPKKMTSISFGVSAAFAAMAGIAIAPISSATYDMGLLFGLKGFIAAVLGGFTSVPGAVIGGLLLGVAESLGAGLISSGYKDAIAFALLVLVLVIKPTGFFGFTGSKRV